MRAREIDQDESLGGSVRRLRLARGLARADFPGVDAKTVARIERGEVEHPQQQTLNILAGVFNVPVEDLGTD
jgi:transcriptional regulator with XRE-family HTH domain